MARRSLVDTDLATRITNVMLRYANNKGKLAARVVELEGAAEEVKQDIKRALISLDDTEFATNSRPRRATKAALQEALDQLEAVRP